MIWTKLGILLIGFTHASPIAQLHREGIAACNDFFELIFRL